MSDRQGVGELLTRIHDLDATKNHDVSWSSKVLNLCEDVWSLLGQDPHQSDNLIDPFVHFLSQSDVYELAKLVVPELRPATATELSKSQNRVLHCTGHMRARTLDLTSVNESLYLSEKKTFAEAELYRARAAFENTHTMNPEEKEKFRDWWRNNPLLKDDTTTDKDKTASAEDAVSDTDMR